MNAKIGSAVGGTNVKTMQKADVEGFFRKYGPMVTRRCRQLLGNDDEAADAAQDVFVTLFGKRDALTAEYPSSLLWTMATNHCLNMLRDRARRGDLTDTDSLIEKIACMDGDNNIEEKVSSRWALSRLFKAHPESSRTMAILHFVDGMTFEETAREVNMSVSGVRKRLRALRDDLKKMEGE